MPNTTVKATCPSCKLGEIKFEIEEPSVFNDTKMSAVILRHSKPGKCNACEAVMVPSIGSAQLNFTGALPVTPEGILVVPADATPGRVI